MCDPAAAPPAQAGLDSAVVLAPDPATALSFLLRADLVLPGGAQELDAARLPALDRLSAGAALGGIVRLIPRIAPTASDAAGRKDCLDLAIGGHAEIRVARRSSHYEL